jgi:hypothetical protein
MARLTITLSDERHQALKEAAARRGKTLGELIDDSLAFYGIKTEATAADLVARARARSSLDSDAAERLAVAETHAVRGAR